MERIMTSKTIVERNLSIVKHINDKYVLFKDENKITVDDGNPSESSVYGVTTIDQLKAVRGQDTVPHLIDIHNDPKEEPYFVASIPTEDLEKLKNGVIHFDFYAYSYNIDENAADNNKVYVLVRIHDYILRDMDEKLIPLPIALNYIEGCLDNKHYDLEKVLEIIKANPSHFVTMDGDDASLIKIEDIPYYNADENRNKFISCKYLPTDEEYNEFVYGKHHLRYDKILERWFSKCKKESTD